MNPLEPQEPHASKTKRQKQNFFKTLLLWAWLFTVAAALAAAIASAIVSAL